MSRIPHPVALALVAAAAVLPARAQLAPEPVRAGVSVSGTLRAIHPRRTDQTLYAIHRYEAQAGERVAVMLRSGDFDAYLLIGDALEEVDDDGAVFGPRQDIDGALATNDDGGGGTDARLEFTFERAGTYYIVVNAFGKDESGDYVLSVESSRGDASAAGEQGRHPAASAVSDHPGAPPVPEGVAAVEAGRSVAASLPPVGTQGPIAWMERPHAVFQAQAAACDRLRMEVRAPGFRPRILFGLIGPDGAFKERKSADGDGEAALEYTLPQAGTWWLVVFDDEDRGDMPFDLSVARVPSPGLATGDLAGPGHLDTTGLREVPPGGSISSNFPMTPPTGAVWERLWFWGNAGTRREITASSSAFEPRIFVEGPTQCIPSEDLDVGLFRIDGTEQRMGGRHSRVVDLPSDGWYRITVNKAALSGNGGGPYTLGTSEERVSPPLAPAAPPPPPVVADTGPPGSTPLPEGLVYVRRGEAVRHFISFYESPRIQTGPASTSRYADTWYWAAAGEESDIRAQSKDLALDIVVSGPARQTPGPELELPFVADRDYTGERYRAVGAIATFPETGWYRLRVMTSTGDSGAFGLAVTPRGEELPDTAFGPEFAPPSPAPLPVPSFQIPERTGPLEFDELIQENIRVEESLGRRLVMQEDWMALRSSSFFVDVGPPVRANTYRFIVYEDGGLAPADIKVSFQRRYLGRWEETDVIGTSLVWEQVSGGVMRTGSRFTVDEDLPQDERITFAINAGGGAGASPRRVVALVFVE